MRPLQQKIFCSQTRHFHAQKRSLLSVNEYLSTKITQYERKRILLQRSFYAFFFEFRILLQRMFYIVATPIGNLDELNPRAQSLLRSVNLIAAEDIRHSRKLCQHFGINTKLMSFQQHNESLQIPIILDKLQSGESIALISDAGMPLISDPGYKLVKKLREERIAIQVISGPCALINALAGSGIATNSFYFEGFIASKAPARLQQLKPLQTQTKTSIYYETPHRLLNTLQVMLDLLGNQRVICVARELTKLYESWYYGTIEEVINQFNQHPEQCKGEMVLVVEGAPHTETKKVDNDKIISVLSNELPPNKAAAIAAKITGLNKKQLYAQITGIQ